MHSARPGLPSWLRVRRLDRILLIVTACSVLLLCGFWLGVSVSGGDELRRLSIAESLLSVDDRAGPMEKMDSSGRFQRYEGITVIMPVNTTLSPHQYQKAYDLIYALYGGIVSPLPVDSYHVTLTGVTVRGRAASLADYNALVTENRARLEAVKWQLHNNARQQRTIAFSVEEARLGSRAVTLTLRPSSDADETELKRLSALMERTLGQLYQRQPRWHMSVAYRRLGLTIDEAVFEPLQTALMNTFSSVDIIVTPPMLCAFYDMRQFRPL